jgi:LruC domain-containing protein
LRSNGTELDVTEAVIFAFDNAREILKQEQTIALTINFKTPIDRNSLGTSPFNPFIVINDEREREIHLPDNLPTSKGKSLLGQIDDNSNASTGKYYRTENNLPWALNFYAPFNPPAEKVAINEVYDAFIPWAVSGGKDHKDWYKK